MIGANDTYELCCLHQAREDSLLDLIEKKLFLPQLNQIGQDGLHNQKLWVVFHQVWGGEDA